jgi:hypothetical protein
VTVEALMMLIVGILAVILLYVLTVHLAVSTSRWTRADRQARELLRTVLTPQQYRQLSVWGYLEIVSPSHPERIYRVPRGKGRVQVREKGRLTGWLCLQADGWVPDDDQVVIHKLMIEANEEIYLQTANRTTPFFLEMERA